MLVKVSKMLLRIIKLGLSYKLTQQLRPLLCLYNFLSIKYGTQKLNTLPLLFVFKKIKTRVLDFVILRNNMIVLMLISMLQ